jgi:hypothetical protein
MKTKRPGIRRNGPNWQANVRVNGKLYYKQFPRNTPDREMQEWRIAWRIAHRKYTKMLPRRQGEALPIGLDDLKRLCLEFDRAQDDHERYDGRAVFNYVYEHTTGHASPEDAEHWKTAVAAKWPL